MKRLSLLVAAVIGVLSSASSIGSTNIVITAFQGNGEIEWSHMEGCTNYWVEWAPSADGPWANSWAGLQSIQPTGAVCCARVPMFYRVIGDYVPQVSTPSLGPLTSAGGNYYYATVSGPGTVHFRYNGTDATEADPAKTLMFVGGFLQRIIYFEKPVGVLEWWVVARSFSQGMRPSNKVYRYFP